MPKIVQLSKRTEQTLSGLAQYLARSMEEDNFPFRRAMSTEEGTIVFDKLEDGTVRAMVRCSDVVETFGVYMPNPIPYRSVSLDLTGSGALFVKYPYKEAEGSFPNFYSELEWEIYDSGMNLLSRQFGTYRHSMGSWNGYPSAIETFVNWPYGSGYGAGMILEGTCSAGTSNLLSKKSPVFLALQASEYAKGKLPGLAAITSDGQILAHRQFISERESFFGSLTWSGAGYAELFTRPGVVEGDPVTPLETMTFTVPEDCIYPLTEIPPPYPGSQMHHTLNVRLSAPTDESWTGSGNPNDGEYHSHTVIYHWEIFRSDGVVISQQTGHFFSGGQNNDYTSTYSNVPVGLNQDGYYVQNGTAMMDNYGGTSNVTMTVSGAWIAAVEALLAEEAQASGVQAATVAAWNADWKIAYKAGILRRKEWFKKNSLVTIAQLKAGVLPALWENEIRQNAPRSEHTYRTQPMTVTYSDSSTTTSTFDAAAFFFEEVTETIRDVVLSYEVTEVDDKGISQPVERREEIRGVQREHALVARVPNYSRPDAVAPSLPADISFTRELTNWYVPDLLPIGEDSPNRWQVSEASPEPMSRINQPYITTDGSLQMMAWNGASHSYAQWSQPINRENSTWGYPFRREPHMPAHYFNGVVSGSLVGYPSSSPPAPYTNAITGTVSEFMQTYRTEVPIRYGVGKGKPDFCDSAMIDGMVVSLTPFIAVMGVDEFGLFHDAPVALTQGETVGMFAHPDDIEDARVLEIYGSAEFVYKYSDNSITFKQWVPLLDAGGEIVDSRRVYLESASTLGYNCLVRYAGLMWPDTITRARGAAAKRNREATSERPAAGDRVMKVILDAL